MRKLKLAARSARRGGGRGGRWPWLPSVFAFVVFLAALSVPAQPVHVYLTWQGDTSKTMTVNFQTKAAGESLVYYDTRSRGGAVKDYRNLAKGASHQIPGLPDGRAIHTVELTRLRADKVYYFIAGDPQGGFSREMKFQTAPDGREPIRFIDGGDMSVGDRVRKLLVQAALQEPLFGLIGGDITYANDDIKNIDRWDTWLSNWEELMVTKDGRAIPMVLAIGNHEINPVQGEPRQRTPRERAVAYLGFFAQAGDRSYFSRQFGKDVIIYALDSGHLTPHGGEQAAWLTAEMEKYKKVKYRFASYHVPLYPSYRRYEDGLSVAGREAWQPIFDRYGLMTAFEHHDHTFKRSKPIKNNQVDPKGTLYLGDGCFGQNPRVISDPNRWYLEKASSTAHFWRIDANKKGVTFTAIDEEGQTIDVYPPSVKK